MSITAAWESVRWPGTEHAVCRHQHGRLLIDGVAVTGFPDGGPARIHYRIRTDADGHTRRVRISVARGPRARRLELTSDGAGRWWDHRQHPLPELDGCFDVDISSTPLTNTLPIRRLKLAIGDAADLCAVYVRMPALEVCVAVQRYTRLAAAAYRYQANGFRADLQVDEHQLLLDYPGVWRRLTGDERKAS